jgi:hypothetical protein
MMKYIDYMNEIKPIQEIRKVGYQPLVQVLGPVDAVRYMRSCEVRLGDYIKERKDLLSNDFYNVVSEITQSRQK